MLAVAKSPRSPTDRELVRRDVPGEEMYSRVAAVVQRNREPLRVQIDFKSVPNPSPEAEKAGAVVHRPHAITVQKYLRVNGVPRRASGLIGQVNAVLFTADDLELIYGSPTTRRRYLDILISQVDSRYLRALQRYHRVVTQRNSLLRSIREGRSKPDELEFWDDELIAEGKVIMERRFQTVLEISKLAAPMHRELTGNGENLVLDYLPNVPVTGEASEEDIARDFRKAVEDRRVRELAQAVTVTGPHRDDLGLLIDGMDVQAYASRGQARTVVLSMKLAEAGYLRDQRRQEPIILLDDVFSELDPSRRIHILDTVGRYEQCFITAADTGVIAEEYLSKMSRFVVRRGIVEALHASGDA